MNAEFVKELEGLINKHSVDNECNTPDFILARYLSECLQNFREVVSLRNSWFNDEYGNVDVDDDRCPECNCRDWHFEGCPKLGD